MRNQPSQKYSIAGKVGINLREALGMWPVQGFVFKEQQREKKAKSGVSEDSPIRKQFEFVGVNLE